MAIIWTYDEAGGFADHRAPSPTNGCAATPSDSPFTALGPRIPLVAISPWAKPHYVSHVQHDHTAITRFIETLFDLPALTGRDANSDALLDLFDFSSCAPKLLTPPPAPDVGTGGCPNPN
jgi:phospholipase C